MTEWKKPFGAYACHLEEDAGGEPDNCVLTYGDSERSSCPHATRRKTPDSCPHWKRDQRQEKT